MMGKDPATEPISDAGKMMMTTTKKSNNNNEALKWWTLQLELRSKKITLLHPTMDRILTQMGLEPVAGIGPFQSSFPTLMSSIAAFAMNPWLPLCSRLISLHALVFLFSDIGVFVSKVCIFIWFFLWDCM